MVNIPSIENEQPAVLRAALIDAGLFLVAYELIRSLVVRPVEAFYANVSFGPGLPFSDFETDVSSLSKHKFDACSLWLRDHMQAISNEQYNSIHRIREFRDALTHGIHQNICNHNFKEASSLLIEAKEALFALDNFWVQMECEVDPEFGEVADWGSVYSNSFAMLEQLLQAVRPIG